MPLSHVATIAALSGASALVFENLWFRSASVALGSSAWSSAIVLSAFMAGLGLGSAGWLWWEPRIRRPMRAYAWIEIAIGVSGFAALVLLPRVAGSTEMRLAGALVTLAAPAALMGATLPILMQALTGAAESFGGRLGLVYGANTLGAVAGVLAGELVLVPTLGMFATGLVASASNGAAAAMAWRMARRMESAPAATRAQKTPVKAVRDRPDGGPLLRRWLLLAAGCLSGALFLAFETALFRFLLLFFTALNTTFAVMLAIILCGIAVGGFSGHWWFRRHPDAGAVIPITAFASGSALVASYLLFSFALPHALNLSPTAAVAAATTVFALPLSVLSGFLFAALGHGLRGSGLHDGAATGLLTAANTAGATIGSLLMGFVLIARFGLERSFFALAAGYGMIALLMAASSRERLARHRRPLWLAAAAFAGALVVFPWGRMDAVYLRFPINALGAAGERRIAFREGQLETLQYLRADSLGQPDYYRLVTNNHSMAATDLRSRRYMRLFAHLASILHPAPRHAALLGVGLGVTATALTEDFRLESIDVVDISPDIAAMLPVVFPSPTRNPLQDARIRLHIDDGRFFLTRTDQRYDVITAEPPPPHYAGVSNLYSREFFQVLADRLKPGGIATYWLPVHDLKADEARAILAAFVDAFPEASLWTGAGLDWIMIGLRPPGGGVSEEMFRAWWTRGPVSNRLREIGVDDPESLGSLFIADGPRLRAWIGDTPPLTDNFPRRISIDTPRDAADSAALISFLTASERPANFAASPLIGSLWPDSLRAASLTRFERQSYVDAILSLPVLRLQDIQRLMGARPRDPMLVKALFWRHNFDFDRAHALVGANADIQGPGVAEYRAQLALMNGNPREAADWLARAISPRAGELVTIRAYCLLMAGDAEGVDWLLRRTRRAR